jgi:hypothetical protein
MDSLVLAQLRSSEPNQSYRLDRARIDLRCIRFSCVPNAAAMIREADRQLLFATRFLCWPNE